MENKAAGKLIYVHIKLFVRPYYLFNIPNYDAFYANQIKEK